MMMPFPCLMKRILLVVALVKSCAGLFEEDAGQLDFHIATTGHGPIKYLDVVDDVLITSDSSDSESTSCHVAARSITDGRLLWRHDVCSQAKRHVVTTAGSSVVTLDSSGILRGWDVQSGHLQWDNNVDSGFDVAKSQLWSFVKDDEHHVSIAVGNDVKMVVNTQSGKAVDQHSVKHESRHKKAEHHTELSDSQVTCSDMGVTVSSDGVSASKFVKWTSSEYKWSDSDKYYYTLLKCTKDEATFFVTSQRGSTAVLQVQTADSDLQVETLWTAEEGLGQTSAALIVEASHSAQELDSDNIMHTLQIGTRLQNQFKSILDTLAFKADTEQRDHLFGFLKVAVLLGESAHRLYGIDTVGNNRGGIRYMVDLPHDAIWHRMVYGSTNIQQKYHEMHAGLQHKELLVLSGSSDTIDWTCVDSTNGKVHSHGSVSVSSPAVQFTPMISTGDCKQAVLVLLKDHSLVSIPSDGNTMSAISQSIKISPNGLYTHLFASNPTSLTTFSISASEDGLSATSMGYTAIPGEKIVAVSYPNRDEAMNSPCNILGDDSLLLKYNNPHMAAFITVAVEEKDNETALAKALQSSSKTKDKKRKPIGADKSAPTERETVVEDPPNLFVNIVDTVSGRILYRASHVNAIESPPPSIVFSENWIFYTFVNSKTRRSELGVLSLYEGMIDSKGLTAFTAHEQSETFSSFDAREAKPVVLAKLYSVAYPLLALGVSATRSGISNRKLIAASIEGSLFAIDRKMLEPRRPVGQIKDIEKKEGLNQYTELIPTVSYASLSYNKTLDNVKSIISSPTNLESQALVLAFGGPDIFFARTAPARGFDVLPESFSRTLLSIVVVGLLVVLVVLQQMAKKKMVKQAWM